MSGVDKLYNVVKILTESFTVDDEAIEELRAILEKQETKKISHEQAEAVGRDLITIIEMLANGRDIYIKDNPK